MKIIVTDQWGTYAAVIGATYLTGIKNAAKNTEQIRRLSCFAKHTSLLPGQSFYIGKDPRGNEIYTLGVGKEGKLIYTTCMDFFKIVHPSERIVILDLSKFNTFFIKLCAVLRAVLPFKNVADRWAALLLAKKARDIENELTRQLESKRAC